VLGYLTDVYNANSERKKFLDKSRALGTFSRS